MLDRARRTPGFYCAAILMTLALAACGGDDSSSDGTDTASGDDTTSGGTTTDSVTAPTAPLVTSVMVGGSFLTVAFDPPSENGGAAVTSYEATCTDGTLSFVNSVVSSPVNIFGLTDGTEYNCTVSASNSAGSSDASNPAIATPDPDAETAVAALFSQFGNNVTVVFNESAQTVTLEAAGRPDHYSPYWDPDGDSGLYLEPGPETTVDRMSPGFVDQYLIRFNLTVPMEPELASSTTATALGAIGIMTTGSPIFNDQEGPVDLGQGPLSGFDNFGAHTGPQTYHYHTEPTPISNGDSNLIGILADGFFLYGRHDWPTDAPPTDLDASGGHVGPTQFNPEPHYHYHIVDDVYLTVNDKNSYLLFGGDYQGTPATITN